MMLQQLDATDHKFRRAAAIVAGLSLIIAIAGFFGPLGELVNRWTKQEEYGHGFLIPVLTAWLLWSRKDVILASIGKPAWSGLIVVLVSLALHVVGELSAMFLFSQLAFIGALIGLVLCIGGYSLLRVTVLPIAFLAFAIPLPYFLESVLTWRLQIVSSELGTAFIRLFGIPVYLEGNIIDLGNYKVQVVEACSGLRYLFPLMSLGFLAAYFFQAPLWQRAVVFLSTIPITIFMNSLRIGAVGLLVNIWGTSMAEGLLHAFEGWVIFLACAGLLLVEIYLLARFASGKSFAHVFGRPEVSAVRPYRGFGDTNSRVPMLASLVLLILGSLAAHWVSARQEQIPERLRFAVFPSRLGPWQGELSALEPDVERGLGVDDYILSDYGTQGGERINLYVAYYASQRMGVSPHSPMVCIPGGGWRITTFERTAVPKENSTAMNPLNRAIIERGRTRQLVYYWFVQRGRVIANEYWSKWYLFVDSILQNRTDGALVRLTTAIAPGEAEVDADARLQSFLQELDPRLAEFLPSALEAAPTSVSRLHLDARL